MTRFPRSRRTLVWLAGATAIAAVVAVVVFLQTRLDRELSDMPPADRRALYDRTLETLRTSCGAARGPEVSDYCREQAHFITHFPECDDACRALAARFASSGR